MKRLAGWALPIVLAVAGTAQAASFSKDMPQIQARLQEMIDALQQWIQAQFGVSPERQLKFVKEQVTRFSQSAASLPTAAIGIAEFLAAQGDDKK